MNEKIINEYGKKMNKIKKYLKHSYMVYDNKYAQAYNFGYLMALMEYGKINKNDFGILEKDSFKAYIDSLKIINNETVGVA